MDSKFWQRFSSILYINLFLIQQMLCSCFTFFELRGQKLTESQGKSDLQMHVLLNVYFILLYCIVFYIVHLLVCIVGIVFSTITSNFSSFSNIVYFKQ